MAHYDTNSFLFKNLRFLSKLFEKTLLCFACIVTSKNNEVNPHLLQTLFNERSKPPHPHDLTNEWLRKRKYLLLKVFNKTKKKTRSVFFRTFTGNATFVIMFTVICMFPCCIMAIIKIIIVGRMDTRPSEKLQSPIMIIIIFMCVCVCADVAVSFVGWQFHLRAK